MRQSEIKTILGVCFWLILTQATKAKAFDCADLSSSECKIKFSQALEEKYQALHIFAIKDIIIRHKGVFETLSKQLDAQNPFQVILKNAINELNVNMEVLNQYKNRSLTDLAKAIKNALKVLDLQSRSDDVDAAIKMDFDRKIHDFKLDDFMEQTVQEFMLELSKAWTDLYAALRPADLAEFPPYAEVNQFMRELGHKTHDPLKLLVLLGAREKLSKNFDMPYLDEIETVF